MSRPGPHWFYRIVALLIVGFSLSLNTAYCAMAQSSDEVALRAIAEKFFAAYGNSDLDGLMLLWSDRVPEIAKIKEGFRQALPAEKTQAGSLTIGKITIEDRTATVRLVMNIVAVDGKGGKPPGSGVANRTLHCVKEAELWRVWREVSSEQDLAGAIAGLKTKEERDALIETEKELLTAELVEALLSQGRRLQTAGDSEQTLNIFMLASLVAKRVGDAKGDATALRGIGIVNYLQGNYGRALEFHLASFEITNAIGEDKGTAAALKNIGDVRRSQGNYDLAIELYQNSLNISKRIGDKDSWARTLNNIGLVHELRSNYVQALECYTSSLELKEQVGDDVSIAATLKNIGNVHYSQGDYVHALENYEKSLRLSEKVNDSGGVAVVLNNIGNVHGSQGTYTQALDCYQRCLKIFEENDDKTGIAFSLNNIGEIHRLQGSYARALEYCQKALTISEAIAFDRGIAFALNNIGAIHRLQGNYDQALEFFQKSLKIKYKIGKKDGIARTLNNIGNVHYLRRNYTQALEYYEKSLKLSEDLGARDAYAGTLNNIGGIYEAQRNYVQALEQYDNSLKISRAIGNKSGIARSLNNIANVQYSLRNYGEAIETSNSAIGVAEKIGSQEIIWQARTIAGKAYHGLNRPDQSREAFALAIDSIEGLRSQVSGSEYDRERFFEDKLTPYHDIVQLLVEQNHRVEAFAYAERAKARALLDTLQVGKVDITRAMTADEREMERRLNSEVTSLNVQIQRENLRDKRDDTRLAPLNSRLETARLDNEAFYLRLYAAHPELRVHRGVMEPLGLERCVELMPDKQTALLEYVVTEDKVFLFILTRQDQTNGEGGNSSAVPSLSIYTLNITEQDLADRVESFRAMIAQTDVRVRKAGRDLFEVLLRPATDQLKGKTRLIVVPDGPLWDLPIQAMQSDRGRYLIEDYSIAYGHSLTAMGELITRRPHSESRMNAPTLLAMGNPLLANATIPLVKPVSMANQFAPLPDAERQVKALANFYRTRQNKIYTGAEATEDRFKAEAPRYDILHLATHGVLNNDSPMYSHLLLSHTEGSEKEDGILEAWELMNLQLKANLVVLSACETARGRAAGGEGLVGLSWALFVAGVPTTVVSQWNVESAGTAELMVEFHRQLTSNPDRFGARMSKAEALRLAGLKLLRGKRYGHPFYWAAFVLVGDGF